MTTARILKIIAVVLFSLLVAGVLVAMIVGALSHGPERNIVVSMIWVCAIGFGGVYFSARLLLESGAEIRARVRRDFFANVDRSFANGTLKTLGDVTMLRDSVCREHKTVAYSLTPLLQDYLRHLLGQGGGKDEASRAKASKIVQDRYEVIKEFLGAEMRREPFSDLPSEERRILNSLSQAASDNVAMKHLLGELSGAISTQYREFQKVQRTKNWSFPLAVIGSILTVFFGLTALLATGGRLDHDDMRAMINDAMGITGPPAPGDLSPTDPPAD